MICGGERQRCLALLAVFLVGAGCGVARPAPDTSSVPSTVATIDPPKSTWRSDQPRDARARDGAVEDSNFVVTEAGELSIRTPITFVVRPLAGPGSMGPSELAPSSDASLLQVAEFMRTHPSAVVRIECAINPFKTSSGSNIMRGAHLAHLVTRWLVDHGVPCERLQAAGTIEGDGDAPVQRVLVWVRPTPHAGEGWKSACDAP